MKMLKATVHHPGRARYWLRRRDTPAAVADLTAGFSDVGAFIGRRRKPRPANDEKFAVVLPLTTLKFARDTTDMEAITSKQWPAGNGLPDFSAHKVNSCPLISRVDHVA